MAQSQIFEGTPGQIVKQLNRLPKTQKFKVTITADELESSETAVDPQLGEVVLTNGLGAASRLSTTIQDIDRLSMCDDEGYVAPSIKAVEHSKRWISNAFLANEINWVLPMVTVGDESEVTFEWWKGDRKLTVYVGELNVIAIQVDKYSDGPEISDRDVTGDVDSNEVMNWILE